MIGRGHVPRETQPQGATIDQTPSKALVPSNGCAAAKILGVNNRHEFIAGTTYVVPVGERSQAKIKACKSRLNK